MTPKTVCFDPDGTLCTNTFGDYEAAEPFPWADGEPRWPDSPGPATRALLDAWSRSVGVDIGGQTAAALEGHGG